MTWGGSPRSFPPAFSIRGYGLFGHRVPFAPFDLFTMIVVNRPAGWAAWWACSISATG